MKSIPKKHQIFIEKYTTEFDKTNRNFASIFGVDENTIKKWIDRYQDIIQEKIEKNQEKHRELLKVAGGKAVESLISLLNSTNSSVQLGAVKLLFESTGLKKDALDLKISGKTETNINLDPVMIAKKIIENNEANRKVNDSTV